MRKTSTLSLILVSSLVLVSCTVPYRIQHHSSEIFIYHNSATADATRLEPRWAAAALRTLASEFGVALDSVTPVHVFVDGEPDSGGGSYFNRFTKSIVLRPEQADLRVLFLHELTHLLLDQIDGSPPYWLDQGLAEYMESRALLGGVRPDLGLHPPFLDRDTGSIRAIGSAHGFAFERFLSADAVDHGWSWGAPLVHYLIHDRWSEWPLPERIRRLLELDPRDLEEISLGFTDYCRSYDPIAEFVNDYSRSEGDTRLALFYGLARFPREFHAVLARLHVVETAPRWRRVLATRMLLDETESTIGPAFERLAPSLLPGPLPRLRPKCGRALLEYLQARDEAGPDRAWYPLVKALLEHYGEAAAAEGSDPSRRT